MKTARYIIIILIALVNNQSYSQILIQSDTTITKQIKVSEIFILNFKTCNTCGYEWKIADSIDTTRLKCISSGAVQNSPHTIGGYAFKSWSFQGITKGDYQLIFIYKRPWETEVRRKAIINVKIE